MKTNELTKIAICITLLCISAYLSFPLPFTPTMVTAQTIIINVIALLLTPKHAFITVLLYIVMGLLGLPVFSGGTSGLAKILSPSGGFILAFLVAAPMMSLLKLKFGIGFKRCLIITTLVGMPIIYLIGGVWMSFVGQIGFVAALNAAVLPFIIGDVLKCIIASLLVLKLENVPSRKLTISYE